MVDGCFRHEGEVERTGAAARSSMLRMRQLRIQTKSLSIEKGVTKSRVNGAACRASMRSLPKLEIAKKLEIT